MHFYGTIAFILISRLLKCCTLICKVGNRRDNEESADADDIAVEERRRINVMSSRLIIRGKIVLFSLRVCAPKLIYYAMPPFYITS